MIHFELSFIYGLEKESNLILLDVDIHLFHHDLQKGVFFPVLNYLDYLVKNWP